MEACRTGARGYARPARHSGHAWMSSVEEAQKTSIRWWKVDGEGILNGAGRHWIVGEDLEAGLMGRSLSGTFCGKSVLGRGRRYVPLAKWPDHVGEKSLRTRS